MSKIMFHLNTLTQGGAERVVSNLANSFCQGNDEIIVATEWFGEDEFKLDSRIKRIHVGLKDEDESKGRLSQAFLRLKYLRDGIKKEKPDVVIAFAQKAIYRTCFAAKGLRTAVIVCVRTDPVSHYDRPIDRVVMPFIKYRPDGAVFQTIGQRDFFSKRWQKRSTIILNPVNEKYFLDDAQLEALALKKTTTVVQHARLVDFKNQPMLIDAFMKVHAKHPEYDLKIYGPDSFDGTKEILEEKIKGYKAEDFIHLMGGSDELEKLVPLASVYAFSSDWEGLPNTLLEAMAMGMPIVATDCPCGGPKTVMTDQVDGLLVPIKNPDALAEGINKLIENPEYAKKLGEKAREIKLRTNADEITRQWYDYIAKVIDGANR